VLHCYNRIGGDDRFRLVSLPTPLSADRIIKNEVDQVLKASNDALLILQLSESSSLISDKILTLFMLDLLGRHSILAKIYRYSVGANVIETRNITLVVKAISWVVILSFLIVFIFLSVSFSVRRDVNWQHAYVYGCCLQLLFEILVFESSSCVLLHFLFPNWIYYEVTLAITQTVVNLCAKVRVDYSNTFLNVPMFAHVSYEVAGHYPGLIVSAIVRSYFTNEPALYFGLFKDETSLKRIRNAIYKLLDPLSNILINHFLRGISQVVVPAAVLIIAYVSLWHSAASLCYVASTVLLTLLSMILGYMYHLKQARSRVRRIISKPSKASQVVPSETSGTVTHAHHAHADDADADTNADRSAQVHPLEESVVNINAEGEVADTRDILMDQVSSVFINEDSNDDSDADAERERKDFAKQEKALAQFDVHNIFKDEMEHRFDTLMLNPVHQKEAAELGLKSAVISVPSAVTLHLKNKVQPLDVDNHLNKRTSNFNQIVPINTIEDRTLNTENNSGPIVHSVAFDHSSVDEADKDGVDISGEVFPFSEQFPGSENVFPEFNAHEIFEREYLPAHKAMMKDSSHRQAAIAIGLESGSEDHDDDDLAEGHRDDSAFAFIEAKPESDSESSSDTDSNTNTSEIRMDFNLFPMTLKRNHEALRSYVTESIARGFRISNLPSRHKTSSLCGKRIFNFHYLPDDMKRNEKAEIMKYLSTAETTGYLMTNVPSGFGYDEVDAYGINRTNTQVVEENNPRDEGGTQAIDYNDLPDDLKMNISIM
jgi:hypothetical protein